MQSDANARLGRNVAAFRHDLRGWSQAELAKRLGENLGRPIDPTAITRLESGRRSTTVNELLGLSEILGVEVPVLLGPGVDSAELDVVSRAREIARLLQRRFTNAVHEFDLMRETAIELHELIAENPGVGDTLPEPTVRFLSQVQRLVDAYTRVVGEPTSGLLDKMRLYRVAEE